jgi:hypothetical protein
MTDTIMSALPSPSLAIRHGEISDIKLKYFYYYDYPVIWRLLYNIL